MRRAEKAVNFMITMLETKSELSAKDCDDCHVVYRNEKFVLSCFDYDVQYNAYYKARIDCMRHMIADSARKKWGQHITFARLHEIADNAVRHRYDSESKLVVIGILVKHMNRQPSILKDMSENNDLVVESSDRFISDDDVLWLQDGDENIELIGNIEVSAHATGICVAVLGRDDESSKFNVDDVCYASFASNAANASHTSIATPIPINDEYVMITSGLGFAKHMNRNLELSKGLNMLVNIVRGDTTRVYSDKQIVRLIIAGNHIGKNARKDESDSVLDSYPVWNRRVKAQTIQATKLFDKFVAKLAHYISVDIMPGELDASTQLLPQQPLHPCVLSKSKHFDSVKCVTNPHNAQYNGRDFLGTSGQNITSLLQYTSITDPIEAMRKTLEWSHIAPTTPDSLLCYPFVNTDPFILTDYPDIYFAGNQEEYNSGTFEAANGKKVLIISVPVFETKLNCVLINLRTLKCELLSLA